MMILTGMFSVQSGAALATELFGRIGPSGTMLLRSVFSSLVLLVASGFRLPSVSRERFPMVFFFGVNLAASNLAYYFAIQRLPLGVVVTLEFLGPLAVAVIGHRSRTDLIWVGLAAVGVGVLSLSASGGGGSLLGIVIALTAGGLWAVYILQSARIGAMFEGLGALSVAMMIAALVLIPAGVSEGGSALLRPSTVFVGLAVALLGSAIPHAMEMEALRRIPSALFAVLMSLEPAVAAAVGFLALGQSLSALELLAIGLVIVASAGALTSVGAQPPRDI